MDQIPDCFGANIGHLPDDHIADLLSITYKQLLGIGQQKIVSWSSHNSEFRIPYQQRTFHYLL